MRSEPSSPFWDSLEVLEGQHWISQGFKGRGELEFSGSLRLSGEWVGTIRSQTPEAQLHILKGARIVGGIKVPRLSVEGDLSDVEIDVDWLKVMAGGRVSGNVRSKVIIVEEGAKIQGRIVSRNKE